jgi:hypothetical protein
MRETPGEDVVYRAAAERGRLRGIVAVFFEFFSASVNPPLPPSSVFGSFLAFVR